MANLYKKLSLPYSFERSLPITFLPAVLLMLAFFPQNAAAQSEIERQNPEFQALKACLAELVQMAINPIIFWGVTQYVFQPFVDAAQPLAHRQSFGELLPMNDRATHTGFFSGISLHGFEVSATTPKIRDTKLFVVGEIHNLETSLAMTQLVMRGLKNQFPEAHFLLEKMPSVVGVYKSILGENILGMDAETMAELEKELAKFEKKVGQSETLTSALKNEAMRLFKKSYEDRNKRFITAVRKALDAGRTVVLNIGAAHLRGGPYTMMNDLLALAPTCIFSPRGFPEISLEDYVVMHHAQQRAHFLARTGDLDQSLHWIDRALELYSSFDLYLAKASILKAKDDPEALHYYSKSLTIQPNHFSAWEDYILYAAQVLKQQHPTQAAVKRIRKAIPTKAQLSTAIKEGLKFDPSFQFKQLKTLRQLEKDWSKLLDKFNKRPVKSEL